ncbi:MAG: carbon storage regulator [Planctomycetota bacterium]
MLVLNRKIRESIVIDGGVTVTVLKTAGNRVTLGIQAPDEVGIRRVEVVDESIRGVRDPASTPR